MSDKTQPSDRKLPLNALRHKQGASSGFKKARIISLCVMAMILTSSIVWSRRGSAIEDAWVAGSAKGYNIVLITLDTTRADHLGCYGNERAKTPVMDRIASEGIRFDDAVSPVPMTLPSHCSIHTGLDPISHGVRTNGTDLLKDEQTTLAEMLRDEGYDTGGFVSCYVLNARFGLHQGFDVYNDWVAPETEALIGGLTNERNGEQVTDATLSWLDQRDGEKPFFLWTHYYDPHDPHEPPAAFAAEFKDYLYDGEIAFVDTQIERILNKLSSKGFDQNTVVIITADHGESLGEHHEKTHTRFIYEATQHVPLILWSPSLWDSGIVVDDAVVGVVDIMPTVLDLLGIESTHPLDGFTLRQCRKNPDRMVYLETVTPYLDNGWAPLFGMRRHLDKFILAPRQEYYELDRDPEELNNRYGARSQRVMSAVQTLSRALSKRRDSDLDLTELADDVEELDTQARLRLEALGYLGGNGPPHGAGELPDPKDMMVVWEMVQIANQQAHDGQHEEALSKLLKAKELTPHDSTIDRHLGFLYRRMGRIDEAVVSLKRYLIAKPTNANIHALLAQIFIKTKQLQEAKDHLVVAYELEPDNGIVLVAMGDFLTVNGNFDEAQNYYRQALAVDPYRMEKVTKGRLHALRQIREAMGQ